MKYELSIIKAKENAEELNRTKTNFLNNMSHELRTPLVGILGYSELLSTELLNEEPKEMVKSVNESGKRMLQTVNFILEIASNTQNANKIELKPIVLNEEINKHFKILKVQADKKRLLLTVDEKIKNVQVLGNEILVQQIINNLVGNAIKYTHSGGTTIEIDQQEVKNKKMCILKVRDTGIGIPEEMHKIIFEEFRQVSEGMSRRFEGTGLGLTIAKQAVKKMNGKIELKSEPGIGSNFTVYLPVSEL